MLSDVTCHSVAQVLQWIANNTSRSALFRGQSDAEWLLESRIARIPGGTSLERALLQEFQRRSQPYLEREPKNMVEWLALGQHFGLATRLLDWTTSPLAALWFAVREHETHATDARLWVLTPDRTITASCTNHSLIENPFSLTTPALIHAPHLATRITAQNSCFILQPSNPSHTRFVPLDSLDNLVDSLVVPAGCLQGIREELDRCGINEVSLFPGLDSLARHVVWRATEHC
jgi:hypothetical protein